MLKQLGSAWSNASSKSAKSWELKAQKLKGIRDRLNVVVEHLHKRRRNGMSAHEAMGIKIRDEEIANRMKLHWAHANFHDEDDRMKDIRKQQVRRVRGEDGRARPPREHRVC